MSKLNEEVSAGNLGVTTTLIGFANMSILGRQHMGRRGKGSSIMIPQFYRFTHVLEEISISGLEDIPYV